VTALAQLVWDCKDLGGMDKLVMMGWAEQVPDGWDTAYASKETVATCTGLSTSTVKRHTRELVKRGVLIDTGGRQQWKTGYTPIYQVNLEFLTGRPSNLDGVSDRKGGQNDPQGSRFRFISSSLSGVRLDSSSKPESIPTPQPKPKTENREPKTVEAKPKPSPEPSPKAKAHGHNSCPDCKEPLKRDVNHFLTCSYAKGRSDEDEYQGDFVPFKPMVEDMPLNPDGSIDLDKWRYGKDEGCGAGSKTDGKTVGQKSVQSTVGEGKPTPLLNPPIAPAPLYLCMVCGKEPCKSPTSDYCVGCWNNGNLLGTIPVGAVPKIAAEIQPTRY